MRNDEDDEYVIRASVDIAENKPYIVYWKNIAETPLSAWCEVNITDPRSNGRSRRGAACEMDATRVTTQVRSSVGWVDEGNTLKTGKADQNDSLGRVSLEVRRVAGEIQVNCLEEMDINEIFFDFLDDPGEGMPPYVVFVFELRKISRRKPQAGQPSRGVPEPMKRKRVYTDTPPSGRLLRSRRKQTPLRRPERSDSDDSSSRQDSQPLDIETLLAENARLEDDLQNLAQEERDLRLVLEKRNQELKERKRAKVAFLSVMRQRIPTGPSSGPSSGSTSSHVR